MPTVFRICILPIAMLLACPQVVLAQASVDNKLLKIARIERDQTSLVASLILSAVYADLDINVTFEDFSARRALRESGRGAVDAETMRIAGIEDRFPDLRAVPVPLITVEGRLYTVSHDKPFTTLADLPDSEIGIVGGILVDEEATRNNLQRFAPDVNTLFKQLSRGRLDLALTDHFSAEIEIRRNFAGGKIRPVGPMIYSVDLFHYVHRRHENLTSQLADALKKRRASGEFAQILNEALRSVARQAIAPSD